MPRRKTTLQWTVAMLLLLLLIADVFGLDAVFGAFLAGVVLRRWAPVTSSHWRNSWTPSATAFFIPVFFVTSGMSLDLRSIVQEPADSFCSSQYYLSSAGCRRCWSIDLRSADRSGSNWCSSWRLRCPSSLCWRDWA
ncbi:MAG TPA: cation:proton antiporter [Propionibacteriaceae bacterium]|nr:cation:proton antiporter [Propionibacteriaceae bacterium]